MIIDYCRWNVCCGWFKNFKVAIYKSYPTNGTLNWDRRIHRGKKIHCVFKDSEETQHIHKPAGQWLVRCSVRSARHSKSCWQLSQVKMESSSKSSSPTLSSWLVTLCSPSSPVTRLSFLSESRSDTAASMYIHTWTVERKREDVRSRDCYWQVNHTITFISWLLCIVLHICADAELLQMSRVAKRTVLVKT